MALHEPRTPGPPDATRALSRLYMWAWPVVLVVALGLSWWSLFELARHYDIPTPLAAGVSLIFDAAALICANQCHRYAVSPDSGAGPRLVMIALLGSSVYLNWEHAEIAGFGRPAQIMYSAPAVVAVMLFELETSWKNREARRARGRIAPALPVLGRWAWLFYPLRSLGTIRAAARVRLDTARASLTCASATEPESAPASVRVDRFDHAAERPAHAADPDSRKALESAHRDPQAITHEVPEHGRQETMVTPARRAEQDPAAVGVDHPEVSVVLDSMSTDADRIRHALRVLGSTRPADVVEFLAKCGHAVSSENVRSVARREREKGHNVVPMGERKPA